MKVTGMSKEELQGKYRRKNGISQQLEDIKTEMCSDYCRYPRQPCVL